MRAAFLTLMLLGTSCSMMQQRRDTRVEKRQREALMENAEGYWDALRWGDLSLAAGYYQDPTTRVAWLTDMGSGAAPRFREAVILRVELGPELEEHEQNWDHEALALVQVQSYTMPAQILTQDVVQQKWYLVGRFWYPEPEEPYRTW